MENKIKIKQSEQINVESDISLVDVFVVLIKNKKIFFPFFIIFCFFSFFIAWKQTILSKNTAYEYKSILSIGILGKNENGTIQYIETPETVNEKIQSIYIPKLRMDMSNNFDPRLIPSISIPIKTNLIILTSLGQLDDAQSVELIHTWIMKKVLSDQESMLNKSLSIFGIKNDERVIFSKIEIISNQNPMPVQLTPGKNPFLVIGLGIFLSIVVASLIVFVWEFSKSIYNKLN